MQSKLRDQAKSLADRMKARQLEGAGDSFKSFVDDMEQAVAAMGPASDKLKGAKWQDALAPEQKALQYLLRAEATFRDIQVAFGSSGGGGGGGGSGATRDMEGLFDLELDTEKNQYEGASQSQSADQQQRQIDEALQKLQQLAKRQQELAEQQRKGQQTSQQRWQQEMLRREAEQLQQQMQQMAQGGQLSRSGQQKASRASKGSRASRASRGSRANKGPAGTTGPAERTDEPVRTTGLSSKASSRINSRTSRAQRPSERRPMPRQLQQMLDRLKQATDDMRGAASSQQAGTPQGEAAGAPRGRAAAGSRADALRHAQQRNPPTRWKTWRARPTTWRASSRIFEGQMRRAFGPAAQGLTREQAGQLASQKEGEIGRPEEAGAGYAERRARPANHPAPGGHQDARGPGRTCSSPRSRATCSAMPTGSAAAWVSTR